MGRVPMGRRGAEGAGLLGAARIGARWGVDICLRREYHCSVGTKEPRASRGAAEGRQKGS
jgi:hypothetical protein